MKLTMPETQVQQKLRQRKLMLGNLLRVGIE
jgi:hypothetical protein